MYHAGGSLTVSTNPRTGKPQYGRPPSAGAGPPRESLLQKVKRVASNPMLGAPAAQISNAAEGVMSTIQPGCGAGTCMHRHMCHAQDTLVEKDADDRANARAGAATVAASGIEKGLEFD